MEDDKLHLNIDYHKKSTIWIISILGFISLIICIIVAATISPDLIGSSSLLYKECDNFHLTRCFRRETEVNYFYYTVSVEKYNQILYLQADFNSKEDCSEKLKYTLLINAHEGNDTRKIKSTNRTLDVSCSDGSCDSELIFYDPYIEYEHYTVKVDIFGEIPVDSIDFSMKFITKEFTEYWLGTKSFFLALSILSLLWNVFVLIRIGVRFWTREIILITLLSGSLFLFNEPLLSLTLTKLTVGWSGISVFCNTQFAVTLILFWFFTLHSEFERTSLVIASVIESILTFIFFVLLSVFYMFTTVELKFNPTFSWENDLPRTQKGIFIAIIAFLVIFAIWMIALIVYSFVGFREKSLRDKFLKASVIFMMILTMIFIGIGAFQPLPRNGTLLLVTVSFYNIYIYVLSWMCTPSLNSYKKFMTEWNIKQSGIDANNTVNITVIDKDITNKI